MDHSLRPRFVLITGASTGIGRACALRLARSGLSVLAAVRTDADARRIEDDCRASGGSHHAIILDVTRDELIASARDRVTELIGDAGLFGLVNNAGICVVGPAECLSLTEFRRQFDVNFYGTIAVTQAMLPLLRACAAGGGFGSARIVNISSITGQIATPLFSAYSASKFALEAVSDAWRLELLSQGISMSLIVPGTIQSEIWRKEKDCVNAMAPESLARRQYGALIDHVAQYVFRASEKALPADHVAEGVERCLTSRRPPRRVLIGWEARVGARAKRFLPSSLFDLLMIRSLRIPRS